MIDRSEIEELDVTSPASTVASLDSSDIVSSILDGALLLGVGWTARTVRELQVAAHGLVRLAVVRHGFRSVLLEGDVEASAELDRFVTTGDGDPFAILAEATPYLASEELVALIRWVRGHNELHAEHVVRIVHGGRDDIETPLAIEESLVDQVTSWHADHGDGIVHLGGVAHVAIDPRRHLAMDPGQRVPTAGALLRERFGGRHKAIGLTFGHGDIPTPIPAPSPGSLEAEFASLPHATSALRLPAQVDAQRLRVVGPHYDPTADARHAMVGDPTTWFDAYVHQMVGHAALTLDRR
jgi:erythromycin esterase